MRRAWANRMVAKASSAGTNAANIRSGVSISRIAPAAAPTSETATRPTKDRSRGGSWVRSYSDARKLPGTRATRLVAVATTGSSPVAISAGKVTTAAPPTSDEMVPPTMPATISIAPACSSIAVAALSLAALLRQRGEESLPLQALEQSRIDVVVHVAAHADDVDLQSVRREKSAGLGHP